MDAEPASRAMLLSVHPRHVEAMVAGAKTTELRRTRPTAPAGTLVLLYATAPVAAIVATCRLAAVLSADAESLWPSVAGTSSVTRREYDAYFGGAQAAHALELADVTTLGVPVSLAHMRSAGSFQPPQTWRLLDGEALSRLMAAHPASSLLTELLLAPPAGASGSVGTSAPVGMPATSAATSTARIASLLAATAGMAVGAASATGRHLRVLCVLAGQRRTTPSCSASRSASSDGESQTKPRHT